MPFLTEELWDKTAPDGGRSTMLINAQWPTYGLEATDATADAEIGWVIDLVSEVRSIRSEMNVPPSARAPLALIGAGAETEARLKTHEAVLISLGRLSDVRLAETAPAGSVPFVIGEATGALSIAAFIDLAAEKARLAKEIKGHQDDADKTRRKLDNPDFIAKAKEEVIAENRQRLADADSALTRLTAALQRLEAMG
jgi:valyl-tRNA synthetase